MHHVRPLYLNKEMGSISRSIGKSIEASEDFEIDTDLLKPDNGLIVVKIHDNTFPLDWYVLQLFLKCQDLDLSKEEFTSTEMNFITMLWKDSTGYGCYVGLKHDLPKFFVVVTNKFDFDPGIFGDHFRRPTLDSKILVGFLGIFLR
ncbi:hypothetical protein RF11_15381 [Thelohanellus kitauei]|uniref:Uncharacterized protein n=1 Tax=Thelohanellus kitauei TaxID=669202 RepID=A0A0C2I564_THEKT|nr:hypothetical protein RF11_15381 [Thelohanellus kitauei]